MKRSVNVHKGEATAGCGEIILKSDVRDTSCFCIIARDAAHKIGALAHALFIHGGAKEKKDPLLNKEARQAIDKMLSNMTLLGAQPKDIEVEMIASENVRHDDPDQDFEEEVRCICDVLKERHIKCREHIVQDIGAHHAALDVETGKIFLED
ncbi:MAG TPA: hypothetical protein PLO93_01495 [Candidatus Omnitrophota bacterium]|nr:hypothetical protein [Candidatus Omnitrophota bacterium]HQL40954.1 hypothetical protein [Candidatus Omnitrophota bacterium]